MKKQIKKSSLALIIFFAVFACFFGCVASRTTVDPLAGWHGLGFDPNSVNKVIQDDYQAFIRSQKDIYADRTDVTFFDDGKGRHAVSIQMWSKEKPVTWHYALIYDNENKRIKIIKWGYGWYQS